MIQASPDSGEDESTTATEDQAENLPQTENVSESSPNN